MKATIILIIMGLHPVDNSIKMEQAGPFKTNQECFKEWNSFLEQAQEAGMDPKRFTGVCLKSPWDLTRPTNTEEPSGKNEKETAL